MGKKKKMPETLEAPVKPSVKPSVKKPERKKRAFNFWADPEMADALERYMKSLPVKTQYTNHLELALEEYLRKRGFAPKDADE